jgi:hypothetical protein
VLSCVAALLELLAILTNTHSSDLSCVSPFALFGTAPSAYEDAEVFCACDGFDPELAGHVAVDILPWSVHCTVGRSRGRRTIRLAAFGCDAGGAACVRKLAFAELLDAVNVDVFETLLLDVSESMVIGQVLLLGAGFFSGLSELA